MTQDRNHEDGSVIRIALISRDSSFRSFISACLSESAHPVEWVLRAETGVEELGPENVSRLVELRPDIVFIDIDRSLSAGTSFISALTSSAPEVTVVAAGSPVEAEDLLRLVRAGASEYIPRPLDRQEISEACERILRKRAPRAPRPGITRSGRLIALYSPKGGTGVSTTASNLAVHIHAASEKKTLLLDLAPALGTCSVMLGLETRYSYLDVVESLSRMDERLLHSFLEKHPSGVRILGSPLAPSSSVSLSSDRVTHLLRLLQRHFDYVVADLGRGVLDPVTARTFDAADHKLIMTTPDLPTLRNVKEVIPHLSGSGEESKTKLRLVVNRYEEGRSMSKKHVEQAVGLSIFQVLGEDRDRVDRSINLAQPLVLNGSSPFAVGVKKMGDTIARDDLKDRGSVSRLGGLLRTVLPPYGSKNGKPESRRGKGKSVESESTGEIG